MNLNRFTVPSLVLLLGITAMTTPRAQGVTQGPPPQSYGQDRDRGGWDAPPREWNDMQRRGFHDGIEGARRDVDNHRRPDVNNRDEYRRPNVDRQFWKAYRDGFRRGYEVAMSHLMGGPGGQMRPPERPWDAPQDDWNDIQRRGFQDGIDGARKDYGNHRRPDVNNRDEYRHPSLPFEQREAYREGFRRGYERAMSHLMGDRDRDH
jgi:hypothetical protein